MMWDLSILLHVTRKILMLKGFFHTHRELRGERTMAKNASSFTEEDNG